MSSALNAVLTIVGLGIGVYLIIHRCDLLGVCGNTGGSSGDSSSGDSSSSGDNTPAMKAFNESKGQKCGCCACSSNPDINGVTCITDDGQRINFTGGLTVGQQCKKCAADPAICSKGMVTADTIAANRSNNQPKPTIIPGQTMKCLDGYHPSQSGACVKDTVIPGSKASNPKADKIFSGCKKGEVYQCSTNGNCVCTKGKKLTKKQQKLHPSKIIQKDACGCGPTQMSTTDANGNCTGCTNVNYATSSHLAYHSHMSLF